MSSTSFLSDWVSATLGGRGLRLPDPTRLWRELRPDETPPKKQDERTIFQKLEPHLVRLQELSMWTDPKSSAVALLAFHLLHQHLLSLVLGSTIVAAAATLALAAFLHHTWFDRVWPVIRVDEPEDPGADTEGFTTMRPECFTAPEMSRAFLSLRSRLSAFSARAADLRRESPGRFCAVASASFTLAAYLGSFVATSTITYCLGVAYLTVPGLLNALKDYPVVSCFLETVWNVDKIGDGDDDETDGKSKNKEEGGKDEASSYTEYLKSLGDGLSRGSTFVSDLVSGAANVVKEEQGEEDLLERYLPSSSTANQEPEEREKQCAPSSPSMPSPEELEEEFSDRYSTDRAEEEEDEEEADKEFLPTERKLPSPGVEEEEEEESPEDVFGLALSPSAPPPPIPALQSAPPPLSSSSSKAVERLLVDVPSSSRHTGEEREEGRGDGSARSQSLEGEEEGEQTRQSVMLRAALQEEEEEEEQAKARTPSQSSEENDDDFELITEDELKKVDGIP